MDGMEQAAQIPWGYILTVVTTMGGYLLALLLIPRILMGRRDPGATLAWIIVIAVFPYLGAAAYYLVGRTRVRRRAGKKRRLSAAYQASLARSETVTGTKRETEAEAPPGDGVAAMTGRILDNPMVSGNTVHVYVDGSEALDDMAEAIENARRHIHLQTYIYHDDETGRRFRDLLTKKAREGVEVRLLVDGWGGSEVSGRFMKPLLEAGGGFRPFAPIWSSFGRSRPHLRNHRKILITDGRLAFTGGLNIGDEYRGVKEKYGPWRDTHLSLHGPAVRFLQEIFAEDWYYASKEDLTAEEYYPEMKADGPSRVQVVGSGPDRDLAPVHAVFFSAVNEARESLFITTPYFVPDQPMLMALKAASWRGVDVRLLLPGKTDMPLVNLASRAYYRELLEAGIKIYEHQPGVLHAKSLTVDRRLTILGSANLDIRSFLLNYENIVLVWGELFADVMDGIFRQDLESAQETDLQTLSRKLRRTRLAEAVARVLSPVL